VVELDVVVVCELVCVVVELVCVVVVWLVDVVVFFLCVFVLDRCVVLLAVVVELVVEATVALGVEVVELDFELPHAASPEASATALAVRRILRAPVVRRRHDGRSMSRDLGISRIGASTRTGPAPCRRTRTAGSLC
jgi:hypothetical protein